MDILPRRSCPNTGAMPVPKRAAKLPVPGTPPALSGIPKPFFSAGGASLREESPNPGERHGQPGRWSQIFRIRVH